MKIKKLILGMLGMSLVMTSCNLDNDDKDNYQSLNLYCCNLVIPEVGDVFATTATYNLTFYYYSEQLTVGSSDLYLGDSNKNYNFITNPIPYRSSIYNNGIVNSFEGGQFNDKGILIQNLKGYTSGRYNILSTGDPLNPAYPFSQPDHIAVMSYTVNHDYTVKTFMPDAIYNGKTSVATVGSSEDPYINDDIRYRVIFSSDLKKADIIFYGAKFTPGTGGMPPINFIIEGLDVSYNKTGYSISIPDGKPLTPSLYSNEGLTPFPAYQFTSFDFINDSSDLTTASVKYTITGMGNTYNLTFDGSYVYGLTQQ